MVVLSTRNPEKQKSEDLKLQPTATQPEKLVQPQKLIQPQQTQIQAQIQTQPPSPPQIQREILPPFIPSQPFEPQFHPQFQPQFQPEFQPQFQPRIQREPITPQQLLNRMETYHEHLKMAQSQNHYQHEKPPTPSQPQHIQLQTYQPFDMPVKRRRRKSRRKVRNNSEELDTFGENSMTSANDNNELLENANNIAFAISLRKNNKHLTNSLNQIDDGLVGGAVGEWKNSTKWYRIKTPENHTPTSFATSTSLGPSQTIIVSSSHSISSTTDKNTVKIPNSNHRKETTRQRATTVAPNIFDDDHTHWQNKYNIDYDNKLEDEYEIIMKEE